MGQYVLWDPTYTVMNVKKYLSDLNGGSLLATESRVIAEIHLRKLAEQEWKKLIVDENVLQKKSPQTALRFANVIRANAVFHKGYDKENPIEINVRHNCIEVLSFPGPLPPVDQKMLQGEKIIARDCRNSRLGDFLKELNLTEGRGTGLPKIRRFMANNGSPKPVFETDSDNVYFLTMLPIHGQYTVQLEAQSKLILDALAEQPLSANELVILLGLKSKTGAFKRTIKELLEQGIIEYTLPDKPSSRLQKYRLTRVGTKAIEVSGK